MFSRYVVTGRALLAQHNPGQSTNVDGTTRYYAGDQLGSARLLTNTNGYPIWEETYYPYGMEYTDSGSTANSSTVNNYKFAGMERDSESTNDNTMFRSYGNAMGRWLSPDPLGGDLSNPQSLNRYVYVLNNPTNYFDPFGLDYWWSGNCLSYDQFAYVDGELDSVDTFFLGCVDSGAPGTQGGGEKDRNGGNGGSSSTTAPAQQKFTSLCPPVPAVPPNVSVDANMKTADKSKSLIFAIPRLKWFYSMVRNRGPWDYKQTGRTLNDFGEITPSPYQDLANFNFGATGTAAGIESQVLLRAAGWAQQQAGTSQPNWGTPYSLSGPYGDDPRDQFMIKLGITHADNGCHQ